MNCLNPDPLVTIVNRWVSVEVVPPPRLKPIFLGRGTAWRHQVSRKSHSLPNTHRSAESLPLSMPSSKSV